ncbi:hypothetical protein GCM10025869_23830 [Homoserinibacter gongjuensis]|uniref:Uncharacterized protein n=1 Tax=Homoserinibacter gongjuensis TaxID=1162968 RepID=A0ABQ6JX94_9MICO|nr:hypothetical protein GCM10025869_23830 [Homoserinibacter gongjuensis]
MGSSTMRIDANGSRSSCLGVRTTALELGEGALDMGVGVDGAVERAPSPSRWVSLMCAIAWIGGACCPSCTMQRA